MGENKRYYWLKLSEDFFKQKEIKKLRRIAGGDVYTIIYLKMLLRALRDNGKLYFDGVEDNFASELALDIDEDVENVKITVAFLMANNILIQVQPDEYELTTIDEMTGSETDSARRVRKMREQRALENAHKALQCNAGVTDSNGSVTRCDTEIDIEKEIEPENRKRESRGADARRFIPPTLTEVEAYAKESGFGSNEFDPETFINYYESKGWMVGKSRMKNWRSAASGWVSRYRKEHPNETPVEPEPENPAEKPWWTLPLDEQERRNDLLVRKEQEELIRSVNMRKKS